MENAPCAYVAVHTPTTLASAFFFPSLLALPMIRAMFGSGDITKKMRLYLMIHLTFISEINLSSRYRSISSSEEILPTPCGVPVYISSLF